MKRQDKSEDIRTFKMEDDDDDHHGDGGNNNEESL